MDEFTWSRDGHGYGFSWKDVVDMPLGTFFFYKQRFKQHEDALKEEAERIRNANR